MAQVAASTDNKVIHIVHFNDVYNINPIIKKDGDGNITKISGGASRFKSFLNTLSPLNPIVLFSGDFLSPSDMATVTNGEHMIPIMNVMGITVGMIGNHDLDYGNDHCIEMLSKLNYPTLNTNMMTPTNGKASGQNTDDDLKLDLEPLGRCTTSYVFKYDDAVTVGVLGISEDWGCTLPIPPENGVVYLEFIAATKKAVAEMKEKQDIDLMIVLTHSRLLNDQLLASKIEGVDLICGELAESLCKSLNEQKGPFVGTKWSFLNRYYNIDGHIEPDASTKQLVHDLSDSFKKQMAKTIGYLNADIDARFSVVRSRESTSGNFMADVVRRAYHCDGVMLCGGMLRADRIMPAGKFTYGDILDIVPFQDSMMVVKMKGSSIVKALEHSVSGVPKAEGRFPQISGMRFLYDGTAPIGERVKNVCISRYVDEGIRDFQSAFENMKDEENGDRAIDEHGMQPLDPDAVYTMATREYLANGGDGFKMFKDETLETVVDAEAGIPMSLILRNFFWAVSTVNDMMKIDKNGKAAKQMMDKMDLQPRQSMLSVLKVASVDAADAEDGDEEEKETEEDTDGDGGYVDALAITPVLEHRIMTVDEEIDFEKEEWKPMAAHFQRLPSFVNMEKLPTRNTVRNLLAMAAIDEVDDEE